MSRSLVGSSSSSTLGSASSSFSSWKRRRSPPERSPMRAVSLSPVNPNRSSIELADTSCPVAVRVTRRMSSMRRQHPRVGVLGRDLLGQVGQRDGASVLDPAGVGLQGPGHQLQHRALAGAVDADDPDPVAGSEPPGGVLREAASHRASGRRARGRRRPCRAAGWRSAAARSGRAAAARPRSGRSRPRSGTSAWTCARAHRGAARPAPCGAGSAVSTPRPTPGDAARPGRARTRRTHLVGVDHARALAPGAPPRSARTRRRGTSGRG